MVWEIGKFESDATTERAGASAIIARFFTLSGDSGMHQQTRIQRVLAGSIIGVAILLGGGCSVKPYRIDIQQGNVVSAEQFAQLRVGMTREQVRFLLGTPLLTDIFHERRWDYRYRMARGDTGEVTSRGIAIHFAANGTVERIDADDAFRGLKPEEGGSNRVFDLGAAKS